MSEKHSKKRVARVGKRQPDKDNKAMGEDDDVAASILKQMDIDISSPRNTRSIKKNQSDKYGKMPKLTKMLPLKRHPLMEKCQKNLKYIKHNRRMDKPRAHLGGRFESTRSPVHPMLTRQQASMYEKGTEINTNVPGKLKDINLFKDVLSDESYKPKKYKKKTSKKIPDSNLNSESEFESFILNQKPVDSDESEADSMKISNRRRQIKPKKLLEVGKHKDRNRDNKEKLVPSALSQKHDDTTRHSDKNRDRSKICNKVQTKGNEADSDLSDSDAETIKNVSAKKHRVSNISAKGQSKRQNDESNSSESDAETDKNSERFKTCRKVRTKRKYVESNSSDSDEETTQSNSDKNCERSKTCLKVLTRRRYIESDSIDSNAETEKNKEIGYTYVESFGHDGHEELVQQNQEKYVLSNEKENPIDPIPGPINCTNVVSELPCAVRLEQNSEVEETVADESQPFLCVFNDEKIQNATNNEHFIDSDDDCIIIESEGNPDVEEIVVVPSLTALNSDKMQNSTNRFVDSDDDCMIVMECPKEGPPVEQSKLESGEINCNIKILNVTTLLGNWNVNTSNKAPQDTNIATKSHCETLAAADGHFNEVFNQINFDCLKEVINKFSPQESKEDSEFIRTDSNINCPLSLQTNADNDCKESFHVPLDVQESLRKLDWKEIWNSVNSVNKAEGSKNASFPWTEPSFSMPCSSSIGDIYQSDLDITGTVVEKQMTNDSLLQNVSNTLARNIYPQKIEEEADILSRFPKSLINLAAGTNDVEGVKQMHFNDSEHKSEETSRLVNADINLSTLKDILSKTQPFESTNIKNCTGNSMEGETSETVKYECSEHPSNMLEVLAMTAFKNGSSPNTLIQNLLEIYARKLQEYKSLKSAERSTLAGLKMLVNSQAEKVKQLELALKHIFKKDSSFFRSGSEYGNKTIQNNCQKPYTNSENLEKNNETLKNSSCHGVKNQVCDNCGTAAKIQCVGCNKAFFCSETCGVSYWTNGHYAQCESKPL